MQLYPLLVTWPAGEKLCFGASHRYYFTCRVKRSWSSESYFFFFFLPLTCFDLIRFVTPYQLKMENKLKKKFTCLCTSSTIEKSWRVVHKKTVSKTQQTTHHLTKYETETSMRRKLLRLPSAPWQESSLLFYSEFLMLQNSSYSPCVELPTPGEPGPLLRSSRFQHRSQNKTIYIS